MELDADKNVKVAYTRGDGLISRTENEESQYYVADGHGDIRFLTDEEGSVTDTYTYTSYGELTEKTGNTDNPYLYTGEYYDENTGFYYLRARYMNPETGSFISLDTYQGNAYDPASLHKYNYAQNNPQMYNDPSGHFVAMIQLCVSEASRAILENWNYLTVSGMVSGMMSSIVARVVGANPEEAFIFGFLVGMGMGAAYVGAAAIVNIKNILPALYILTGFGLTWSAAVEIAAGIACVSEGCYGMATFHFTMSVLGIVTAFLYLKTGFSMRVEGAKGSFGISTDVNGDVKVGDYLANKAPKQVAPGKRYLEGQYVNDKGVIQPWKAYYDEYGRLIARTDYNAGNIAQGIPETHYHLYEWGPGKLPYEIGQHIKGEFMP